MDIKLTFILENNLPKEHFLAKYYWLLSYWSADFQPLWKWENTYVYHDLKIYKEDICLK